MYQFAVSNICILFKLSLNLCTEMRLPILVRNIFLLSQSFFCVFVLCTSFTFFLNRFALLAARPLGACDPLLRHKNCLQIDKVESHGDQIKTIQARHNLSSSGGRKKGKYKIKQKKGKKQQRQKMKFSLFFFLQRRRKRLGK